MESSQFGENEDDGMVSASNVWSPSMTERAELTENADVINVPSSDVRLSLPIERPKLPNNVHVRMVPPLNGWSQPVKERPTHMKNADTMNVPSSDVRLSLPIEKSELTKDAEVIKVPPSDVRSPPVKERSKLTKNADVRKVPPTNERSPPVKGNPTPTKNAEVIKVPPTNVRSTPVKERLKLTKNADVRNVPPINERSPPVKGKPTPTKNAEVIKVPPTNVRSTPVKERLKLTKNADVRNVPPINERSPPVKGKPTPTKNAEVIKVPPSNMRPPPVMVILKRLNNANAKTTDEMKSFILNNKECLLKCVDITSDLPTKLLSNGILTHTQFQTLQGKIAEYDSIGVLVDFCSDIIQNTDTVGRFLAVLDEAQHKHVANFIRGLGQRRQEFGFDWPLSDCQTKALDDNLDQLDKLIDSKNGLAEQLYAAGCITSRQRDRFMDSINGNLLLVTKVRCSSAAVFERFLLCLIQTKQHHVVSILKPELARNVRPLSNEEQARILSKIMVLTETLYVDVNFLSELESANCITTRQRQFIESVQTMSGKCMLLLDMIRRGSQQDFQGFIECLRKTKQMSLIAFLENQEQQVVVVIENMKLLRDKLLTIIDVENGLFDELLSLNVLTKQQVEEAQGKPTQLAIDLLLNYIIGMSSSEQCEQFLLALEKTHQKHTANYIRCKGVPDPPNEWPLLDSRSWILNINYPTVLELIDTTNGLLDELVSADCISLRQAEGIAKSLTTPAKNITLLKIVQRGNITNYDKFIECLRKVKQYSVAAMLAPDQDGMVPPLSQESQAKLVRNNVILTRLIVTKNGLTQQMFDAGCITELQKKHIESAASYSESNTRLLDILKRGSQADFDKFIGCLEGTNQKHVKNILTGVVNFDIRHERIDITFNRQSRYIRYSEKDGVFSCIKF